MLRMCEKILLPLLAAALLCGCARSEAQAVPEETAAAEAAVETTAETTVETTVPADGDPDQVTCRGSYTSRWAFPRRPVATVGGETLTNGQLQVYYWMEVAAYRQGEHDEAPDFDQPLDTQPCEIDNTVNSWQQYFLQQALDTWHSAQALIQQSENTGLPVADSYAPNAKNHRTYMTGQPARSVLYGYKHNYPKNRRHQEYLEDIPNMLEQLASEKGYESLDAMVEDAFGSGVTADMAADAVGTFNEGYMYYTSLTYYLEAGEEALEEYASRHAQDYASVEEGRLVDMRHILLIPEDAQVAQDGTVTASEESWEACLALAETVHRKWKNKSGNGNLTAGGVFAQLAYQYSDDADSALLGGLYENIRSGQLEKELDAWLFDEARQAEDTVILRTDHGCHILFFVGSQELRQTAVREDVVSQQQQLQVDMARVAWPIEVDYDSIALTEAQLSGEGVILEEVLYPDIAHERYPDAQLYLQQDFPNSVAGGFRISTHGCGVTTMAMLATYMADEEVIPPDILSRYSFYCSSAGTDTMMFMNAPQDYDIFLRQNTSDWRKAREAMEEGCIVVCVQFEGYWTRGGHYLLLEELKEDGLVQVRDSNIFNYGRLEKHKQDAFEWSTIIPAGMSYWIYEAKQTRSPACSRCGEGESACGILTTQYICQQCRDAQFRRSNYLTACAD